jgi:hypothetical protein
VELSLILVKSVVEGVTVLSFDILLFFCGTQWVSWKKFRKNCAVFQKLNACHGGHSVF